MTTCLWGILLVSVLSAHSTPVPEANPVVHHQFATFATTKSFVFHTNNNKGGGFNYQFAKPQQYPLDIFSKYFSQTPSFVSATGQILHNVAQSPASPDLKTSGHQQPVETPAFAKPSTPIDSSNGPYTLDIDVNEPASDNAAHIVEQQPIPNNAGGSFNDETNADLLNVQEEISSIDALPNTKINEGPPAPHLVEHNAPSPSDTQTVTQPELSEIFQNVQNIPLRKISRTEHVSLEHEEPMMHPRQDSTIEHPAPFISPRPKKLNPLRFAFGNNNNRGHPQTGLFNFNRFATPTSNSGLQSGFVPAINRFTPQHNIPVQTPYPGSQPSFQPGQTSFSGSNLNQGGSLQGQNVPPISYPSQQNHQFPSAGPGSGGQLPPEPENGYNPYHLSDNYPEPPYESEFTRIPEENFDSGLTQRSSPHLATSPQQPLDFAQATLRNVKTDELLQVVRRKQVPRDCAYNTISYGSNGEDCVEGRKKRSN